MKTSAECFPCFLRQSLQVARICGCSADLQVRAVKKLAAVVAGLDPALSPPANAKQVYRALAEITGCDDPYRLEKQASNEQALQMLPALRREIAGSAEELTMAIRFAIAGNIIDYGAFQTFDIDRALDNSRKQVPAVDHSTSLIDRIDSLPSGAHILYLADNCGEIVYDRLLIEYLFRRGFTLTVAVKDGPIINDALREDALVAGLDRYARIISNGSRCPGTVLADCSPEFRQVFATADLVIAKGQGNFESLSEVDREMYFLLTVKCPVAARHMAKLAGMDEACLPGKGEMAVFHSAQNNEMVNAMKTRIKNILQEKRIGQRLTITGWVRTRRDTGGFSFIEIGDGSCLANLQVIADSRLTNYDSEVKHLSTGTSVIVEGELKESPAKGQAVEINADRIEIVGHADPETYPLQKKRHSFEFLREISHLRPRTNALGAVGRVRSRLSYAVHQFFQERGFLQVHTPIITTSDCEGAGEMFQVSSGRPGAKEDHFFGRAAGLTVSGQLQAEVYALALGDVYTFGPTFRAERSNTSRHLAEFWMIEPEMAFCDLKGNMQLAEEMLKYLLTDVMTNCPEDMELFDKFIEKGLLKKLQGVVDQEFAHITYTEAVDRLKSAKKSFEFPVEWGLDLQSEHERYLTEEVFKKPLTVTDYPAAIKPFYMRVNEDGKTVAAMDILVPGIGEIVGGSQREERYDVLVARMQQAGINIADYQWYLDLRLYGSVPHAGFGLGFERLIQFVTGMANIREVIPFPRTPGSAPC